MSSLGPCYVPSFHLSDPHTFSESRYGLNYSRADFFSPSPPPVDGTDPSLFPHFFHGNTLVNWGLFVRPLHPLMRHTIVNIVAVVTAEYRRESVLNIARWDVKYKSMLCSTTFIMTTTLREMVLGKQGESTDIERKNDDLLSNNPNPGVII